MFVCCTKATSWSRSLIVELDDDSATNKTLEENNSERNVAFKIQRSFLTNICLRRYYSELSLHNINEVRALVKAYCNEYRLTSVIAYFSI